MAGHLGCDMRAQAPERPAGQVFQVAAGVLHLVEGAFDPFPQPVELPLDVGGPGQALVAARRGQDLQAPGLVRGVRTKYRTIKRLVLNPQRLDSVPIPYLGAP